MSEEKTFNIPLRKQFNKAPRYRRAKKAVTTLREFLVKHMKSDDIRIGASINLKIWEQGIRNPPHHVKVTAVKDDKGVVTAELFGVKVEKKTEEKKDNKKEDKSEESDSESVKEAKPKKESKSKKTVKKDSE